MLEQGQTATSALYSGLKRLRQNVGEAVLSLARLPATTNTGPGNPTHVQLAGVINQLSVAALVAQSALDKHETAAAQAVASTTVQPQPQQQQHKQEGNELHPQMHKQVSALHILHTALTQLEQAAQAGLTNARAAVRSAHGSCAAADINQVLDALLNMAEAALQAQQLLNEYADSDTTAAAVPNRLSIAADNQATGISTQLQRGGVDGGGIHSQGAAAIAAAATLGDTLDQGLAAGNTTAPRQQQQHQQNKGQATAVGGTENIPTDDQNKLFNKNSPAGTAAVGDDDAAAAAACRPSTGKTRSSHKSEASDAVDDKENSNTAAAVAGGGSFKRIAAERTAAHDHDNPDKQHTATTQRKRRRKSTSPVQLLTANAAAAPPVANAAELAAGALDTPQQVESAAGAGAVAGTSDQEKPRRGRPKGRPSGKAGRAAATKPSGAATAAPAAAAATPACGTGPPAASKEPRAAEAPPADLPDTQPAAAAAAAATNGVQQTAVTTIGPDDPISRLTQRLSNPNAAKQAAKALAKMARESPTDKHAMVVTHQTIPALVQLMGSSKQPGVWYEAAVALRQIVDHHPEGQTAAAAAGGIHQLLHIFTNNSMKSKPAYLRHQAAVTLLDILCEHEDNARAAAAAPDCISVLCQLLLDSRGAVFAAEIIKQIARYCSAANAQQLISALSDLVKQHSGPSDTLTEAVNALGNFCVSSTDTAQQNQALLAAADVFDPLIQLLHDAAPSSSSSSGNSPVTALAVAEAAARTLGHAMIDSAAANRAVVAAAGGLEALVDLLFIDDTHLQAAAAYALYHAVDDSDDNQMEVAAAAAGGGAVAQLVVLLSSSNAELQYRAACLLHSLADGDNAAAVATQDHIMISDGLGSLIKMLSYDPAIEWSDQAAEAAARALMLLADLERHRGKTGQAIQPLLQLLLAGSSSSTACSSDDCAVLESCAGALMNVVRDNAANQQQLIQLGGVEAVVQLLTSYKETQVLLYCAGILYNLAAAAPATAAAQTGRSSSCVAGPGTSAAAAAMHVRSLIAQAGAIKPLVKLLCIAGSSDGSSGSSSWCDFEVAHKAAGALMNIAYDHPENNEAVVQAGAIPLLVQLLSVEQQIQSASAAANAAASSAAAAAGRNKEEDDTRLLNNILEDAAGALATLAAGQPKHQAEIAAAGGIEKLVALLNLAAAAAALATTTV